MYRPLLPEAEAGPFESDNYPIILTTIIKPKLHIVDIVGDRSAEIQNSDTLWLCVVCMRVGKPVFYIKEFKGLVLQDVLRDL